MPAHAIINPRAVVVIPIDTSLADKAVICFWWHVYLAFRTDWRLEGIEWLLYSFIWPSQKHNVDHK